MGWLDDPVVEVARAPWENDPIIGEEPPKPEVPISPWQEITPTPEPTNIPTYEDPFKNVEKVKALSAGIKTPKPSDLPFQKMQMPAEATQVPTTIKPLEERSTGSKILGAAAGSFKKSVGATIEETGRKLRSENKVREDWVQRGNEFLAGNVPEGTSKAEYNFYTTQAKKKQIGEQTKKAVDPIAEKLKVTGEQIYDDIPEEDKLAVADAQKWLTSKEATKPQNIKKTVAAVGVVAADQSANTAFALLGMVPGGMAVGAIPMIAQEKKGFVDAAKANGITDEDVLDRFGDAYAIPSGAIEYGMESIVTAPIRAIPKLGKGKAKIPLLTKAVGKVIKNNVLKTAISNVIGTVGTAAMEGTEELTQTELQDAVMYWALTDAAQKNPDNAEYYTKKREQLNLKKLTKEKFDSFIIGFAASLPMVAGSRILGGLGKGVHGQMQSPEPMRMEEATVTPQEEGGQPSAAGTPIATPVKPPEPLTPPTIVPEEGIGGIPRGGVNAEKTGTETSQGSQGQGPVEGADGSLRLRDNAPAGVVPVPGKEAEAGRTAKPRVEPIAPVDPDAQGRAMSQATGLDHVGSEQHIELDQYGRQMIVTNPKYRSEGGKIFSMPITATPDEIKAESQSRDQKEAPSAATTPESAKSNAVAAATTPAQTPSQPVPAAPEAIPGGRRSVGTNAPGLGEQGPAEGVGGVQPGEAARVLTPAIQAEVPQIIKKINTDHPELSQKLQKLQGKLIVPKNKKTAIQRGIEVNNKHADLETHPKYQQWKDALDGYNYYWDIKEGNDPVYVNLRKRFTPQEFTGQLRLLTGEVSGKLDPEILNVLSGIAERKNELDGGSLQHDDIWEKIKNAPMTENRKTGHLESTPVSLNNYAEEIKKGDRSEANWRAAVDDYIKTGAVPQSVKMLHGDVLEVLKKVPPKAIGAAAGIETGLVKKAIQDIKAGKKGGKAAEAVRRAIADNMSYGETVEEAVAGFTGTAKPGEPLAFSRKEPSQLDIFGGEKSISQLESEEASRLQKKEIERRQAEKKGGEADLSGLPIFENQDFEGSQQTLQFSRKQPMDRSNAEAISEEVGLTHDGTRGPVHLFTHKSTSTQFKASTKSEVYRAIADITDGIAPQNTIKNESGLKFSRKDRTPEQEAQITRLKAEMEELNRRMELTPDERIWEDNNKLVDFFRNSGYTIRVTSTGAQYVQGTPADVEKYWSEFDRNSGTGFTAYEGPKAFGISEQVDRGTGKTEGEVAPVKPKEPPAEEPKGPEKPTFQKEEDVGPQENSASIRTNAQFGAVESKKELRDTATGEIEGGRPGISHQLQAPLRLEKARNQTPAGPLKAQLSKDDSIALGRPVAYTDENIFIVEPDEKQRLELSLAEKVSGRKAYFIGFEGVYSTGDGVYYKGSIFLDKDNTQPIPRVIFHETIHALNNQSAKDVRNFYSVFGDNLNDEGRAEAEAYAKKWHVSFESAVREKAGDYAGDVMGKSKFWEDLANKFPDTFRKFVAELLKQFKKLMDIIPHTPKWERILKDNKAVYDSLLEAYAAVRGRDIPKASEGMAQFMMKAFHGSPYKFDKFEMRPYTGEGAMAFGHGLYFTSNEDIAAHYAKALSQQKLRDRFDSNLLADAVNEVRAGNKELTKKNLSDTIIDIYNDFKNTWKAQSTATKEHGYNKGYLENLRSQYEDAMRELKDIDIEDVKGNLYEVSIHKGKDPSEYDYLKWDEPLTTTQLEKIDRQAKKDKITEYQYVQMMQELDKAKDGGGAYRRISARIGSDRGASNFLLRAGIDGIDYPAGSLGTTFAKRGGRNYVVFDPNAVTIEERATFSRKQKELPPEEAQSNLKKWFGNSKVVDEKGNPLRVFSGHWNTAMYGTKYSPKKGVAGGYYASEDPKISSNYAIGKAPSNEARGYFVRDQKGGYSKKLSTVKLTDEQIKKLDDLKKITNSYGEHVHGDLSEMDRYIQNNKNHDAAVRRWSLNGGSHNIQNIYEFMDQMGGTISYNLDREPNEEYNPVELQQNSPFEDILDELGLDWNTPTKAQPGVYPIYLKIENPLDASTLFPKDLLAALKEKAKRERPPQVGLYGINQWSKEYPLKEWVKEIESGEESWTTKIPQAAIPIIKSFGYDGIKELGMKGAAPGEKRQVNWVAFDANQIKSATGNRGSFDSSNPDIMFSRKQEKNPDQLDLFAQESKEEAPKPVSVTKPTAEESQLDKTSSEEPTQLNVFGDPATIEKPILAKSSTEPAKTAEIADFGQKIGGARKDLWKERGLSVDDMENMTKQEIESYATKANVWPNADYAGMVEAGMPPEIAFLVKNIKDRIAVKPEIRRSATSEERDDLTKRYVDTVKRIKEGLEKVRTIQDINNVRLNIFNKDEATGQLHQTANENALLIGGKAPYRAFQNTSYDVVSAKRKISQTGWPAKQEGWMRRFEVHSNDAGSKVYKDGKEIVLEKPEYFVVKKNSHFILENFGTREEAEAWAKGQLSTTGGERIVRPFRENMRRTGPTYRTKDVTGEDLLKDFGFRGGEFGNWTNTADRQQSLNQAYDGMMDLARVLGVPPKAISLNGELGIAFGARGSGGAAAHYEPSKIVINLTKTNGAGALAHEWAHAMDDYFGRQATGGMPAKYISEGTTGTVRPEVIEAWQSTMSTMLERIAAKDANVKLATEELAKSKRNTESWLREIQKKVDEKPDAEALELLAMLRDEKPKKLNSENASPEKVVSRLKFVLKNKYAYRMDSTAERGIAGNAWWLERRRVNLLKAEAGESQRSEKTDFLKGAEAQKGEYWTRKRELFARAFESYVEDKINAEKNVSDYLVHSTNSDQMTPWTSVYPKGQDRTAIGKSFDKLFETIKTKETDKGVMMFSRKEATGFDNPPQNKEDYITWSEIHKSILSNYFDSEGNQIAVSNEVPAKQSDLPIGKWRIDDIEGIYGHEIQQLQMVDPNNLIDVEEPEKYRRNDVDKYEQWRKEGLVPPPIEVVKQTNGRMGLKIVDGHRRAAAAKRLGMKVPAWVAPIGDHPEGLKDGVTGEVQKVGMTFEMLENQQPQFSRKEPVEPPQSVEEVYMQATESMSDMVKKLRGDTKSFKEFRDRIAADVFVPLNTRLKKIGEPFRQAMRRFEFHTGRQEGTDSRKIRPLLDAARKMSIKDRIVFDLALKNGDGKKVNEIVSKYKIDKQFDAAREMLNDIHRRAVEAGFDINFIKDFWPRSVLNPQGLLMELSGMPEWGIIEDQIHKEEKILKRPLNEAEQAKIANQFIARPDRLLQAPGHLKERTVGIIDNDLDRFYDDSMSAIVKYTHEMNQAIETRKFFNFKKDDVDAVELDLFFGEPKTSSRITDIEGGIGRYVLNAIQEGRMKPDQQDELVGLLKARFNYRPSGSTVQKIKELGYITSMGSGFSSFLTQIGDLTWAYYVAGPIRASAALGKAFAGKSAITKEDLGLERVAEEFRTGRGFGKALQKIFDWTLLTKMDAIGKESLINGALSKYRAQAKAGNKDFLVRVDEIFGEEGPQVIDDLKNKVNSENVKYLLFNRLLDFQPMTLSEMPLKYLNSPNGRLLYMLKTFTIKQIDAFRNESINIIAEGLKTGNKLTTLKGMRNLIYLTALFVMANAGADALKDWLFGRKPAFQDKVWDNILRLFGLSRFIVWEARRSGPVKAFWKLISPPMEIVEAPLKDFWAISKDDDKSIGVKIKNAESWKMVPFLGKHYYWWFGGGRASELEKRDRNSPYAKLKREIRQQKAKAKRIAKKGLRYEKVALKKGDKEQAARIKKETQDKIDMITRDLKKYVDENKDAAIEYRKKQMEEMKKKMEEEL